MTVNVLLTPPASQPLTLADAKAIIRTDDDSGDHDALIARLIDVARQQRRAGHAPALDAADLALRRHVLAP